MAEILYSKQAEHFTKLKEKGITQAELLRRFKELEEQNALSEPSPSHEANPWHITPRSVNRWYNGYSQIKRDNAARIIEAFELDCTVEWLRGEAEFMNKAEEQTHVLASIQHDGDLSALGFGAYSELCGFTLTATVAYVEGEKHESGFQQLIPQAAMIVARGDKSVTVPRSDIKALQDEVRDFVDFKLTRMMNR